MSRLDYPFLQQFLGAYFHQDWMLEHSHAEDVVQSYVASEPRESVEHVLEELDQLILANPSEAELEHVLLEELDCYYEPGGDGLSNTEWIKQLRSQIEAARAANSSLK